MSADRWYPFASRSHYGLPTEGSIVAFRRSAWRVIEVRPVPEIDYDDHDREIVAAGDRFGAVAPHYVIFVPARGGKRKHYKIGGRVHWYVLDEHYPVCVECGEPYPCLHLDAERAGTQAAARLDKLASILPGCCWACGEPISARQERISFAGANVWLPTAPDGPAFHLRQACRSGAARYEEEWAAADPSRPRSLLTLKCDGSLIVHGDGEAECFGAVDSDCPSVYARHRSYSACYTQTHGCPRECSQVGHPGCYVRPPKGLLNPSSEGQLR